MSTIAYSTSANRANQLTVHSSGISKKIRGNFCLEDTVRHKLAYEWKNVYRLLSQDECYSKG